MKYELAKELKDAGFSQTGDGQHFLHGEDPIEPNSNAYVPTLEELIEACGAEFGNLAHPAKGHRYWNARGTEQSGFFEYGKTPTEAVARLWLAMVNKKL